MPVDALKELLTEPILEHEAFTYHEHTDLDNARHNCSFAFAVLSFVSTRTKAYEALGQEGSSFSDDSRLKDIAPWMVRLGLPEDR
eukprot:10374798-Karenia_brevis.AAC.1